MPDRKLPDVLPEDIETEIVDLDEHEVIYQGERLTAERAAEVGEDILRRSRERRAAKAGRPSLGEPGTTSRNLTVRLPEETRQQLDAVAEREGRRSSDVVRDALDRYLEQAG